MVNKNLAEVLPEGRCCGGLDGFLWHILTGSHTARGSWFADLRRREVMDNE